MSDKVYIGPGKVGGVEVKGEYAPVSRVTMWYDDEHCYTAGDDTGRTVEMENPWATQAIVDSVYQRLKGFVYRPFEAKEVSLDPAVELGDGVNIGGIYSVIGQMDVKLDKEFAATLACPEEAEIDHEYPYQSAQDRELKRRVKLGQSYFGTRISRKDGLVIERTDGETVTAKAVLNAEELSFYDGAGGRVLFFDPATGTYKFMGVLNVADKFVVDQAGNVTMKGSINLSDGSITWGGKGPVKYQFSASTSGPWHDMMGANDKYRRDSLDGGTTWGAAYQFKGEDGRDGSDGADGSDAQVPGYILNTYIDATKVESFYIRANKLEAVCPKGAESDTETGFILTGAFDKKELRYLRIDAFDGGSMPYVRFSSPSDATASWQFNQTNFRGILNFENADVQGLTATFA